MHTARIALSAVALLLLVIRSGLGEDLLFEDRFEGSLSGKWQVVGLKSSDYRIRQGSLEMRVQPGKLGRDPPMLKVLLPFTSADTVTASVEVTLLDAFTEDRELAGLYLLDEHGPEFGAKKERVDGKLVFAPGEDRFKGNPGEEGNPKKYEVRYTAATEEAGPLRILVDREDAFFQVGPSASGAYLNFFYSAIRPKTTERGFCLLTAGAPKDASHWVRFDNFRVVKR